MDLAGVQAVVRAVNPYYVDMLTWRQDDNIIKAIPKKQLSYRAHDLILKVLKRFGGKYVSPGYFELVLVVEENGSRRDIHASNRAPATVGVLTNNSPAASGSVLNQLQAQLTRLATAGAKLVKEA